MTLSSQNVVAWHDRNTTQHKVLLDDWAGNGGGWLPGQSTVATFMTGGFGFVIPMA